MRKLKDYQEKKEINFNLEVFKLMAISLFILISLTLIFHFASLYFLEDNQDQICIPKMSGFFQSLEENHSVAVFDMTNADQKSLAVEVYDRINRMKIGVNGR